MKLTGGDCVPTALKASPRKIIRDRKTGKLYDFGTSNRSFVQVASTLKSLGIKNSMVYRDTYFP